MSQIFHPSINLIVRLLLAFAILAVIGVAALGYYAVRSPWSTGVGVAQAQPVAYSHQQHVGQLGLDCRYCHTGVEAGNSAGLPSTETCMGCHAQVATESSALEPVQTSLADAQGLAWIRVHDLADYVYFNHAIHVAQGVGCETCHGRIDEMPVVSKAETLQMDWCLECHREPERYLRPREEVFTMGWEPPADQPALGEQLIADHGIRVDGLTDCSICHR